MLNVDGWGEVDGRVRLLNGLGDLEWGTGLKKGSSFSYVW